MRRKIWPIILLVAGCALARPEPAAWERTGATPEQAAADLQACRHAAQARINQDLQLDQEMGADPTSQGSLASNLSEYDADRRVKAMAHDCMVALDYHPAAKTAP